MHVKQKQMSGPVLALVMEIELGLGPGIADQLRERLQTCPWGPASVAGAEHELVELLVESGYDEVTHPWLTGWLDARPEAHNWVAAGRYRTACNEVSEFLRCSHCGSEKIGCVITASANGAGVSGPYLVAYSDRPTCPARRDRYALAVDWRAAHQRHAAEVAARAEARKAARWDLILRLTDGLTGAPLSFAEAYGALLRYDVKEGFLFDSEEDGSVQHELIGLEGFGEPAMVSARPAPEVAPPSGEVSDLLRSVLSSMDQEMPERPLLACPHCGAWQRGTLEVYTEYEPAHGPEGHSRVYVRCLRCGCQGPRVTMGHLVEVVGVGSTKLLSGAAILLWDQRAGALPTSPSFHREPPP